MASEQLLIDMGFPTEQIEKALKACGHSTEQAMEWLLAHANDGRTGSTSTGIEQTSRPTPDEPMETSSIDNTGATIESNAATDLAETECNIKTEAPTKSDSIENAASTESGSTENAASTESGSTENAPQMETGSINNIVSTQTDNENKDEEAKSIKCDECQKLFKSNDEVEFHAVKSGHSSFSESTEEKKPLTNDEKKEKLKFLEEKMKERRKEKEEEEHKEHFNREKKRIQMGKNIAETKQKMLEKEMKLLAEEKRREKLEDKLARQRVKEQIERDKIARKEMFGGTSAAKSETKTTPVAVAPVVVAPKKTYDTARLQIRLPVGSPLVHEFKAKEPLSAVRLWIELNVSDYGGPDASFNMSTTFPRKIFSDEDMDKPLDLLGLTPSSVLVVTDVRR